VLLATLSKNFSFNEYTFDIFLADVFSYCLILHSTLLTEIEKYNFLRWYFLLTLKTGLKCFYLVFLASDNEVNLGVINLLFNLKIIRCKLHTVNVICVSNLFQLISLFLFLMNVSYMMNKSCNL
jgi:hypothetical protein